MVRDGYGFNERCENDKAGHWNGRKKDHGEGGLSDARRAAFITSWRIKT